jgi:hypothetical protein
MLYFYNFERHSLIHFIQTEKLSLMDLFNKRERVQQFLASCGFSFMRLVSHLCTHGKISTLARGMTVMTSETSFLASGLPLWCVFYDTFLYFMSNVIM